MCLDQISPSLSAGQCDLAGPAQRLFSEPIAKFQHLQKSAVCSRATHAH